jgi:hypothetical protein
VVARPRPIVVVPVTPDLTTLTARALGHALALSDEVIAVSVLFDPEPGREMTEAKMQRRWEAWGAPARLVVLHSQYHSVVRPILRFIGSLQRREGERVLVLIPEIISPGPFQAILHNRMGRILASALQHRTDVVVGIVPFHVEDSQARPPASPSFPSRSR